MSGRARRGRGVVATTLAVAMLTGCGSSAPAQSAAAGASSTSATDGTVNVQGHALAYHCQGEGSPTVVLLHGLDNEDAVWFQTIQLLPGRHICSFDRVNTGQSSRDPHRHHADDSVAELEGFLTARHLAAPYVLVGHSFGGLLAMMYAAAHPADVSDLLLVEATLPLEAQLDAASMTPAAVEALRVDSDDNAERVDFYEAVRDADPNLAAELPDVPVVYLFGATQTLPQERPPGAYVAGLHAMMESVPQGSVVDVQSGHGVPVEAPDDIAAAIDKMLP